MCLTAMLHETLWQREGGQLLHSQCLQKVPQSLIIIIIFFLPSVSMIPRDLKKKLGY